LYVLAKSNKDWWSVRYFYSRYNNYTIFNEWNYTVEVGRMSSYFKHTIYCIMAKRLRGDFLYVT
jgi:hypothetical protein